MEEFFSSNFYNIRPVNRLRCGSVLKLCRELFVLMTVLVYSVLAGDKQLTTTGQFVIRLINILGVANLRTSTLSPFLVWISSRNSVFASLREKFHC